MPCLVHGDGDVIGARTAVFVAEASPPHVMTAIVCRHDVIDKSFDAAKIDNKPEMNLIIFLFP